MKVIIDRFENGYAVVELNNGKEFFNLPQELVPNEAKEGDVFNAVLDNDGNIIGTSIDLKETQARESRIKSLMSQIFKNKTQE